MVGFGAWLLCGPPMAREHMGELYCCLSYDGGLSDPEEDCYFTRLKKGYLFYIQRDAYGPCVGQQDLGQAVFLPYPYGFEASPAG